MQRLDAEASAAPGDEAKTYSSAGFGAVFAEVRVDPDLCTIRVARVVGAYDAGRIVNPRLAHSQASAAWSAASAWRCWRRPSGTRTSAASPTRPWPSTSLPVCADIHELDAIFVESEDTIMNPLGVKGLAELGLCGVAPAIANAVWHATGKRVRELPITPDRLLMA